MKMFYFILLIVFGIGCEADTASNKPNTFKYPVNGNLIQDITFPSDSLACHGKGFDFEYCASSGASCFYIMPFYLGVYPIMNISTSTTVLIPDIFPEYPICEILESNFLDQSEITQSLKIWVDTINEIGYELRHKATKKKANYKAYLVALKNEGNKNILLDRFGCIKLILEAKDETGKWRQIEIQPKTTCGLEGIIREEYTTLNLLPPQGTVYTKILQRSGAFTTDCRIKYQSYNQIDSIFRRSGPNTGYFEKTFQHSDDAGPIYSNTFRQGIDKEWFKQNYSLFF